MGSNEINGLTTLAVILIVIAMVHYRKRWRPSSSAHGTASLADDADLKRAGLLGDDGLILGRTPGKHSRLIRMPRYCHLSVFAPTGAGKGVSFLIPWLLTYLRGALIVLDFKGELFKATAKARRSMGHKVVRIDPFGVCGPGADSLNPLDMMGDGPDCADDARAAAEAMVVRTGEEKDPHWNSQAANVITGLLTLILRLFKPEARVLCALREMVTAPGLYADCAQKLIDMGGIFARLGGVMLSLEDKEKAGVLSTVNRHTTFLDSLAIMAATKSGWNARELLDGNTTVYVILPPHQLEAQSGYLRLVIASLLRMVGREGMKHGKECLFLLDEAGQLGHMQPIEQGLTLLRASGLRMALFFQSVGQLKEVFKDKESVLLDNTEQIYFGVQSLETAERVSKMLGTYTESAESYSDNHSRSYQTNGAGHDEPGMNISNSRGISVAVHSRELLKPDEVMQLPGEALIAFLRGVPPILARRVLYYRDPLFNPRAQPFWVRPLVAIVVAALATLAGFLLTRP